jgi:nitrate/TMAO reductase-like tetraheme cytochrome c subunit
MDEVALSSSASILETGITALALVTIALVVTLVVKPRLTAGRPGKALAFVALFVLPLLVTALGVSAHLEKAKSTEFCLSCHEMEPYGESLHLADPSYLAANHFLNNRVPRDHACFTCHTTYTMFGDVKAKANGLVHLWVHYSGKVPANGEIELYNPYQNRECLYCHGAARTYLEDQNHIDMKVEIASGEVSCLECHGPVHDVESVADAERWSPTTAAAEPVPEEPVAEPVEVAPSEENPTTQPTPAEAAS